MPLGLTASGLRIFRFGGGGASWRHWRGQHVLPTCRRSIDQSRATTELRVSGACNVASAAAAASAGGQPLPAPVWLQWPSMRHGGGCAQQFSSRLACRCSQGHCKGGGCLESLFCLVGQGSAPALCARIRSTGTSQRGGGRLRWGCEACNEIFGPSRRVSSIATTRGERDTDGGRTSTGRACLRECLSWTWTTDLPPTARASLVYSPPV